MDIKSCVTWLISRPIDVYKATLSEKQIVFLKKLSRKTWSFFEKFVGPEDNWLPPDNFQEHPIPVVAHRTSPTNMGLHYLPTLLRTTLVTYLPLIDGAHTQHHW